MARSMWLQSMECHMNEVYSLFVLSWKVNLKLTSTQTIHPIISIGSEDKVSVVIIMDGHDYEPSIAALCVI